MKAPIATKIGNMDELGRFLLWVATRHRLNAFYLSSSVYGSATRGPLGFLRAEVDSCQHKLAKDKESVNSCMWSSSNHHITLSSRMILFVYKPWDHLQLHPPLALQGVEPAWGSLPMSPEWRTIWKVNKTVFSFSPWSGRLSWSLGCPCSSWWTPPWSCRH